MTAREFWRRLVDAFLWDGGPVEEAGLPTRDRHGQFRPRRRWRLLRRRS